MKRKKKVHDKHRLYQISVQNPTSEVAFMKRVFKGTRKKEALTLREDFCGTAILSATWVKKTKGGKAQGIDLHKPTLDYAKKVNIDPLEDRAGDVELVLGDVLDTYSFQPDIIAAYNFSYFIFKERTKLLHYFTQVHKALNKGGMFFMDIYGGPEAQHIQEEETDHDDFTYVWDQAKYNPITGEILCHIHFDPDDGPRMKKAFTYDWRLWGLPEIKDVLRDAGFDKVDVYWEGTDPKTDEGNGVFKKSTKGDNSLCWVAYIVAYN